MTLGLTLTGPAMAQGGAGGTGGAGGAGGAATTSGAGASGAGTSGEGASGGEDRAILDPGSGCGCRTAGAPSGAAPLVLIALGGLAAIRRRRRARACAAIALVAGAALAPACSSSGDGASGTSSTTGGQGGAGQGGAGQGGAGQGGGLFTGGVGSGGQGGGPQGCVPPDMLVVLDRTMSMHKRPDGTIPPDTAAGHMESKWYIAIQAVEQLTGTLDGTIRFGLELFPRDPGGGACITLSQRIQGITATNPECQQGEVVVPPDLGTAAAVDAALDPETTLLCTSTPIGQGLTTARDELAAIAMPERPQYVLLITDGGDTCSQTLPLDRTRELAALGVNTYVIGFGAVDGSADGINKPMLNDLACAGRTSTGFPASCVDDGGGNYRWDAQSNTDVFLQAQDGAALTQLLQTLGAAVCCDCVPE